MKMAQLKVQPKRDESIGFRTSLDNKKYLVGLSKEYDTIVSRMVDSIIEQLRLGTLSVSNGKKS